MDPRKQGIDEKRQILKLNKVFNNTVNKTTYYLENGFLKLRYEILTADPPQLDAISNGEYDGYKIIWTMKGGQKEDGGAQTKQFRDIRTAIEHAPNINVKTMLVVLLGGAFWSKSRNVFLNYEKLYNLTNFSILDILQKIAQNKNVIIIFEDDLELFKVAEPYNLLLDLHNAN